MNNTHSIPPLTVGRLRKELQGLSDDIIIVVELADDVTLEPDGSFEADNLDLRKAHDCYRFCHDPLNFLAIVMDREADSPEV